MKKIIALLLALCMLFVLSGCGKEEQSSSQSSKSATGEIDALAADGKVDNVKYGLGSDIEEVMTYYSDLAEQYEEQEEDETHIHSEDEEYYFYELIEEEGYNVIDISTARFYYETGKEDLGVTVIATDSETFGFTPGVTMKYEVEDAVKAEGKSFSATEEELRFLAVRTEPVMVLRYEFEGYQLDFYFYENCLITTVLTDTENWGL